VTGCSLVVIAGLDPAIQATSPLLAAAVLDARVKPGHDNVESDRIRDELAAMGIVLKDNKDGTTTWEVAR
jgi:cysteinyl-tRNA synthetase